MKLPFAVDRSSEMSLTMQMFQGLKKAIVRGVYKPGQMLPGIHEMSEVAGVSEKVSRQALAQLADAGWIVSKRGARSTVADRGKERLGKVLFFNSETGFGFHSSWLVEAIRSRLLRADYKLTAISAYDLKKDGSSRLLSESLKERWDLVIEMGMRKGARRAISESGWPFLVLGDGGVCIPSNDENCIGKIELRNGRAVPEFVHACVKNGVRRVVQFLYDEGGFDVSEMLEMPGISCVTIRIPRCRNPFGMYSGGHEQMCVYMKESGGKLPDVFLFTDDHLAHGGLLALMERGIKIPEDVKVVTHANRGSGPFWVKPLTRLEMDPVAQGAAVAKAVLDYFRTRILASGIVLGSDWKAGETF